MLEAVVFDFDGVIADSEPLHFQSFRDVLAAENIALTESEYYERYLGLSDRAAFRAVSDQRGTAWSDRQTVELMGRKAARFEELERDAQLIFPAADRLVRQAASVVPIAVASGARRVEILRILDRADLTRCFAAVIAVEDVAAGKPAPDPYLRALTLLRGAGIPALAARHCIAIEDSRWGLQSARAAGLRTVAVTNTYGKSALADVADVVIESLEDMNLDALTQLCIER